MAADMVVRRIIKVALVSRIVLLTLQVVSNNAIPDHDAGVFRKPKPKSVNEVERTLVTLLEGLERWDGQYFLNVAEYGYIYEKSLAFFPLFPNVITLLANSLFLPLHAAVNYHLVLLLSAVVLNAGLFVASAVLLHRLTHELYGDEHLAYKSAVLFCVNPASVFFSAAYSEALFNFLTLAAMVQHQRSCHASAALLFGLSAFARANGAIGAGFALYTGLVQPLLLKWGGGKCRFDPCRTLQSLLAAAAVCAPFLMFQYYAYKLYCEWPTPDVPKSVQRMTMRDPDEYVLPGQSSSWCYTAYPLSYGFVQSHYWGVGLFTYYQWKQIPNFLLAAPTALLCIKGIFNFAIKFLESEGIYNTKEKVLLKNLRILPYIVHCCFLLAVGITTMHVQVLTRLILSASPTICWFAAELLPDLPLKSGTKKPKRRRIFSELFPVLHYWRQRKQLKLGGKLVLVYFVSYFVVGTVAFANNFPWT